MKYDRHSYQKLIERPFDEWTVPKQVFEKVAEDVPKRTFWNRLKFWGLGVGALSVLFLLSALADRPTDAPAVNAKQILVGLFIAASGSFILIVTVRLISKFGTTKVRVFSDALRVGEEAVYLFEDFPRFSFDAAEHRFITLPFLILYHRDDAEHRVGIPLELNSDLLQIEKQLRELGLAYDAESPLMGTDEETEEPEGDSEACEPVSSSFSPWSRRISFGFAFVYLGTSGFLLLFGFSDFLHGAWARGGLVALFGAACGWMFIVLMQQSRLQRGTLFATGTHLVWEKDKGESRIEVPYGSIADIVTRGDKTFFKDPDGKHLVVVPEGLEDGENFLVAVAKRWRCNVQKSRR